MNSETRSLHEAPGSLKPPDPRKTNVENLREFIAELHGRGMSESQIAIHAGKRRGYIAQFRQGRVGMSEKQATKLLETMRNVDRSGSGKIVAFMPPDEKRRLIGEGSVHLLVIPADERSRKLLARYSLEVEKYLAGEPYNLAQFKGKKVYIATTSGKQLLTLELDEAKIRRAFEQSNLDRLYRYEHIETPGVKKQVRWLVKRKGKRR